MGHVLSGKAKSVFAVRQITVSLHPFRNELRIRNHL